MKIERIKIWLSVRLQHYSNGFSAVRLLQCVYNIEHRAQKSLFLLGGFTLSNIAQFRSFKTRPSGGGGNFSAHNRNYRNQAWGLAVG